MKKTAFTICAKNYIGLALALEQSIKSYNKDINFFIFVADEFENKEDIVDLPKNVLVAKERLDIRESLWNEMSFKYDLTEFCTSIKPSCFKYIFKMTETDACIYFDPDILTFSSLEVIYSKLDKYSIFLTPHITTIETIYSGDLSEQRLLYSGIFNLGFIAIKNSTVGIQLIDWWEKRLEDRCFQNMMDHYFTDQKWMDFVPSLFPESVYISSNLGFNVAPWNFYEREIIKNDESFFVTNRITNDNVLHPLVFVHFSGFNYKELLSGKVVQGNIKDMVFRDDYSIIFEEYSKFILESHFSKYIKHNYSYNYFNNNVYINKIHRSLYRRLVEDGKLTDNPFMSNGTFYSALKKNKVLKTINLDKTILENVPNVGSKIKIVNKLWSFLFSIVGSNNFFRILKLMRIYSKVENHVYLISDDYKKDFELRK